LFTFFEMRLRVAKGVAGQDEIRGCDGHCRNAGNFQRGGEEPGAEAFAKRGEAIEELGAGGDATVDRNFVKKVASQELQFAAHAKVMVLAELQIVKHIKVKKQDELGCAAGMRELAIGESTSNRKEMIGDALHRGDDHDDAGCPRGGANKTCSMEHAARTEKRTAAELEGDDVPALLARAAGVMHSLVQLSGASFRC